MDSPPMTRRRLAGHLVVGYAPAAAYGVLAVLVLYLVVGDRAATVNGTAQFTAVGAGLIGTVLVLVVVGFVVLAGTTGTFVRLIAGRCGDGYSAVRELVAEWRTWLLLGGLCTLFWLVVLGAAVVTQLWSSLPAAWPAACVAGFGVLAGSALYLLRFALAVPVVAVEGVGGWRVLRRARWLTRGHPWGTLGAQLAAVAVAALLSWLVRLGTGRLAPDWRLVVVSLAGTLIGWFTLILAAVLLTCCYRRRINQHANEWVPIPGADRDAAIDAVERLRQRSPARPARVVPVLAAACLLLAPGVVYASYPLSGLAPWPVVSDQVVRHEPATSSLAMTLTRTGRPVLATPGRLIWCQDSDCRGHHDVPLPHHLKQMDLAARPDGSVAVTGWRFRLSTFHLAQVALACRSSGCRPAFRRDYPVQDPSVQSAIAPRPGGGLALVEGRTVRAHFMTPRWRLTLCDDLRCATPRTVPLPTLSSVLPEVEARTAAVTVTADDRPVVAISGDGRLRFVTCRTAGCAHPYGRTVTVPGILDGFDDSYDLRGSLATTPGGRPVVAVPTRRGTTMVICRDRYCAHTRTRTLPFDSFDTWPGLSVDHRGRVLFTAYDGERLSTVACPSVACGRPVVHRLERVPDDDEGYLSALDLTLGTDGQPRIAWQEVTDFDARSVTHLLVCHRRGGLS